MIKAEFYSADNILTGYKITGHSMSAPTGEDIICAFVSSAAFMAANTITEVCKAQASTAAHNGFMEVNVTDSAQNVQDILNGLKLHLTELEKQYPENINVIITEV